MCGTELKGATRARRPFPSRRRQTPPIVVDAGRGLDRRPRLCLARRNWCMDSEAALEHHADTRMSDGGRRDEGLSLRRRGSAAGLSASGRHACKRLRPQGSARRPAKEALLVISSTHCTPRGLWGGPFTGHNSWIACAWRSRQGQVNQNGTPSVLKSLASMRKEMKAGPLRRAGAC